MKLSLKTLGASIGRSLGLWPRPALPPRYSDGWQAGTPLDATKAGDVLSFSALRRGLEILTGQLVSTPMLDAAGEYVEALQATDPADLETAASDMLTTGNGWLALAKGRFVCIQASRVSGVLDAQGNPHYILDNGGELDMQTTAHLQCRNYFSPFVGDALLDSYSESAGAIMATNSIFRQLQGNGSHAEVFLSTDLVLTATQMADLRTAYEAQTATIAGKAGGTVILSAGMKPSTVRALPSALDADIVKSLNFSVEEAARITGVPLSMLSTREVSGGYNSSIEANRAFYRATMRPLFHRVERELSRVLGVEVKYDVQEILLGSGQERADVLAKLLQNGVLSIDEARASLNYGAIPNGGVHGVPLNSVPLETWIKPPVDTSGLSS